MHHIVFLTAAILVCAQSVVQADTALLTAKQERIQAIDKELSRLKTDLKEEEKEELEIISKGQKYMVADWPQYGEEIQEARKKDLEGKAIEQRILELEQEKMQLLNTPPAS